MNNLAARTKKVSNNAQSSENEFASCSDDGIIYLWDIRVPKRPARTLNIGDPSRGVVRANFSRGIYAMDLEDDFVVIYKFCNSNINIHNLLTLSKKYN